MVSPELYGLLAEFTRGVDVLRAARLTYAEGYRALDAYTPFPVDGLSDALGFRTNAVPLLGLGGGIVGAATGLGMQLLVHVRLLPINVGGRPLDSWPAFIPVMFEMAVLFSALTMLAGLLILNGHPEPYHPVFNVAAFARASRDRFFLCIEARDPRFDVQTTRQFLQTTGAVEITEVLA